MVRRLSPRDAADVLTLLAEVLATGLPLPRAVAAVRKAGGGVHVQRFTRDLESTLEQGAGFDSALPLLRAAFGPGTGELLLWAEEQGYLEQGVRVLARLERQRAAYRRSLALSFIPLGIGVVLLAVVPGPLAGPNRVLVAAAMVAAIVGLALRHKGSGWIDARLDRWRLGVDRLLWDLPYLERWVRTAELIRYLWCLTLAAEVGSPLLVALARGRRSLANRHAALLAEGIEQDLERGVHLAEALASHLPLRLDERAILENGETTGHLDTALRQVAEGRMARTVADARRTAVAVAVAPYALFLLPWIGLLLALVGG